MQLSPGHGGRHRHVAPRFSARWHGAERDPILANRAPEYKVAETEVGVVYGAFRELDEHLNWRFASFSLPFWTQPPPTPLGRDPVARAFVPMDDTHTMHFCISNKRFVLSAHDNEDKHKLLGGAPGISFNYEYLPNTTDWYGRRRLASKHQRLPDRPRGTRRCFDGEQSRRGYHLNHFFVSLLIPADRDRFKADEEAYLSERSFTETQKLAVLSRDYIAMIAEGGNIYFLGKIGATDGKPFVQLTASITGMTPKSYTAMMVRGERPPGAPLTMPQTTNRAEGGM